MGWLARLISKEPPAIPAGASYFVDGYGPLRDRFVVRLALAGQEKDVNCKIIGPVFSDQANASAYQKWLEGKAEFRYPAGRA